MIGTASVLLTMAFEQVGRNRWTGRCRELGTATHGRTLPQVRDELVEMVALHLNALEDVGERERFFSEHGIKLYSEGDPSPSEVTLPVAENPDSFVQIVNLAVSPTGSHQAADSAFA